MFNVQNAISQPIMKQSLSIPKCIYSKRRIYYSCQISSQNNRNVILDLKKKKILKFRNDRRNLLDEFFIIESKFITNRSVFAEQKKK